jgi:hypothetical protein
MLVRDNGRWKKVCISSHIAIEFAIQNKKNSTVFTISLIDMLIKSIMQDENNSAPALPKPDNKGNYPIPLDIRPRTQRTAVEVRESVSHS